MALPSLPRRMGIETVCALSIITHNNVVCVFASHTHTARFIIYVQIRQRYDRIILNAYIYRLNITSSAQSILTACFTIITLLLFSHYHYIRLSHQYYIEY